MVGHMNNKINDKLNHYLKNKIEDSNRFSELDKELKKKTQARYINQAKREKQIHNTLKNTLRGLNCLIIDKLKVVNKKIKTILKNKNFINWNIKNNHKKLKHFYSTLIKTLKNNISKKNVPIIAGACIVLLLLGISVKVVMADMTAYKVSYNGKQVGIVKNKDKVYYLVDIIEDKLDIAYNADVIINKDNLNFDRIALFGKEISSDDELLSHFTYFQNLEAKSYCLYVNDQPMANLSSKKDIEALLNDVQDIYVEQDNENIKYEEIGFLEKIDVREEKIVLNSLKKYDSVVNYILKGTTEERKHTVKKGENYWTIAEKYDITPKELEDANPEVKPERLQIGQQISLIVPKPLLTVVTKEKLTYFENIPYEITYENTGALYKGEKNIKLRGKKGKKEILAEVERHNGLEVSKEEIESKVIKEPVTQVVLVGTKDPPPLIGTGSFDKPTRGRLSSRFGMRWGRMHSGIDIAASKGTTIRAADGGIVTFAGWKGNYGLAIIIDHGQNKSTLYAHCNEVFIKKGTKVYKGQKIASVGSTGRSTGPHLHFEVRLNKKAQNPLKYVKY